MATEKPRFTITVDEKLLKELDDFRFENRYSTRTQATIELIRLGLETLKQEPQLKQDSKK
ncbi:hypothetical protein [Bacillus cereus]|uniref:Uncharacterized protein n=1 Tax=Bacillus cereus VD184 TaxID=1053242 RepID=A0A9W5VUT4_BACCE|nr:hypothetical protein [Bacillus cereus]EOQ18627.1 hypothetical protein IKC_05128 [Bacillus cereus VD184]